MPALPRPTARTLLFWTGSGLVFLLGLALGNQDVVWPALFLALLPVVSGLALLLGRPRFTLERHVTPPIVTVGEDATVHAVTTARRPSPAGTVVAEDAPGFLLGAPHRIRLRAARAGEVTELSYPITARRRGRHRLDGFRVSVTDLLGFWVHRSRIPHVTELVATPTVHPLLPRGAAAYGMTGETPIPQTAVSGPDDVMVREYQARDDVRRIHWPSTARSGTLMVRREEAAWDPTAWVVLDSRAGVHPREGGERPTFEWLVSAAASVGLRLLADGYTVTLIDAAGSSHAVASDRVGAAAVWLSPLVDIEAGPEPDLHEATQRLAQAGGDHLIIALLGGLDRPTADLLAATTASRHERRAFVLAPDPAARADFDEGHAVLADHGWDVHEVSTAADLAAPWASGRAGAR
ncbi:MAG: DUF58 domain-containing protein [Propionibacteriaceae bacterium]|nr:DUF58 domain-containing protein [Propionibacteriaceae bacterium]